MNMQETFGIMVFNDDVMRQRLPKETYRALHRTCAEGRTLNPEVASVVSPPKSMNPSFPRWITAM